MIRYILLCLLIPIGQSTAQQQNTFDDAKDFDQYLNHNERISLHTNSTFLLVGETLQFNIHCLHNHTGLYTELSTVANIELIGEDARPVLQTRISLKNGRGSGDLFLPSSLRTGNYTLIAYTNWMKNFPIENFFQTNIRIINPFKKPFADSSDKPEIQVDFFPEGGHLITGHPATIGYIIKQNKKSGDPFLTCTIVDDLGNKVHQFMPSPEGIGVFTMKPQPDRIYKALLAGTTTFQSVNLPVAEREGIGIHVTKSIEHVNVKLMRGGSKATQATLNVVHYEKTLYTTEVQFETDSTILEIPVTIFPDGIATILVVNSNDKIECERKLLVRKHIPDVLQIKLTKKEFSTREKISLELTSSSRIHQAYLSVNARIHDPLISKYHDQQDIDLTRADEYIDFQLLTSSPGSVAQKAAVTDNRNPLHLPEVRGILISGTVTDQAGTPLNKEPIYLSVPAHDYHFLASRTDSSGHFYFNTNKLKDNSNLLIQLPPQYGNNYRLRINDDFINQYETFAPPPILLDSALAGIIKKRSVWTQIENTYFNQKRDSLISDKRSIRFYEKSDKVYLLDNYVRFPSMEDVLIEYIPEISLRKKGDQYTIKVVNFKNGVAFDEDPLILLDGIPLFDHNQVIGLNPLQIKKIEIIKRKYFYGPLEVSGIISLESYEGDALKMTNRNYTIKNIIGLQPEKFYYHPDYSQQDLARIPDFRYQLYWNPSWVITDKAAPIEFYTSDVEGTFEIIVAGYDSYGNRLFAREYITVKNP
jgi:hypothetical protein